jgi:hypothetical protein
MKEQKWNQIRGQEKDVKRLKAKAEEKVEIYDKNSINF